MSDYINYVSAVVEHPDCFTSRYGDTSTRSILDCDRASRSVVDNICFLNRRDDEFIPSSSGPR